MTAGFGLTAVIRAFYSDGGFVALSGRLRLQIRNLALYDRFRQHQTFAAATTYVSVADYAAIWSNVEFGGTRGSRSAMSVENSVLTLNTDSLV